MGRNITWTEKQKQVRVLLEQGATTQDILAAGHSKATLSRVREALAKERKEAEKKAAEARKQPGGGGGGGPPASETLLKPRTLEPIVLGGLVIEPADWRINQYGGFLILTTYEMAKQQYGYEGTVGEFICDAIQVLRTLMGVEIMPFQYLMQEVKDNGAGQPGTETDQGSIVSAESGPGLDGQPEPTTVT